MALVRFGGGVSEIRGSIAGNVFSRSRAGGIIRNRAVPVNPNTPAQSQVRSWMQQATDGFRDLSAADVDAWNTFASTQTRFNRLGEPYTPSGKQVFTEGYLNLLSIAATVPPTLPAIEANPNLPSLEITGYTLSGADNTIEVMELSGVTSNFGDFILVQATGQMPASVNNFLKYFRTIGTFATDDPLDISVEYASVFPATATGAENGNVIGVRASAVNSATGLASEWIYLKLSILAFT